MRKTLRIFAMAVAMLLPFAMQAQETLTVYDGTNTNSNVPVYGLYADYGCRSQFIYPASELSDVNGGTINQLTFYSSTATASFNQQFTVYMKEVPNTTFATAALEDWSSMDVVYVGTIGVTGNQMQITLSTPFSYGGGNLMVGFQVTVWGTECPSISWYGQTQPSGTFTAAHNRANTSHTWSSSVDRVAFLPKTTFTYEPAAAGCAAVKNLAVDPNLTTSNSMTFGWTDEDNTSATYFVYRINGTDTTLLQGDLTAMTYTATGLDANTAYTFGVKASCGEGDTSRIRTVSGRTACGVVSAFPWVEDFESYAANTTAIPCMLNEHIEGSGSQVFAVNTTTQSGNTTNKLMLPDMSNGTMTKLVLPEMSLNGNYEFIIDVLRSASGASYPGEGIRVFASVDGELDGATEMGFISRNHTQTDGGVVQAESATGWYTYEFPIPITSGTCYIILRGESKWGASTYMDNFRVALAPTCAKPRALTVEGTTSNSISLSWSDAINSGATYSVMAITGDDTTYVGGLTDTAYTLTGLDTNANYSIVVRALCSDSDSSRAVTVSASTLRAGHTLWSFNLTGAAKRGDVVFDAEAGTITAPVWYTATPASDLSASWSLSNSARAYLDTAGDGSYTCYVSWASSLAQYLKMNTPTTLRIVAQDTALYTDYVITLVTEDCVKDRNLVLVPERVRLTASWSNPDTSVTEHHVLCSDARLDLAALSTAQYVTVSGAMSYTFEGLARATKYYVYEKSACDTEWLEDSVMTKDLGECIDVVVADGTSTNSYVPVYCNYLDDPIGMQSVYPASMLTDLVGVTIDSLHYFVSSRPTMNFGSDKPIKVTMAIVDVANLSGGFQSIANGTVVYDGTISNDDITLADGFSIKFSTPFTYTGGNLLIAIQCNPNDVGAYSNIYFYGVSASSASRYANGIGGYNFTVSGTTTGFLPKFSFSYCQPAEPCPDVTDVKADTVFSTSATISWTRSDADYLVGNQIIVSPVVLEGDALASATAIDLDAEVVSYEATGLDADQDYYVYVKALCNGADHPEGTSGWATAQFHTFPTCRVPEIVSTEATGKHTAKVVVRNTGVDFGQASNYNYIVSDVELDAAALAAATPTATGITLDTVEVDNLASATTYYIYFQNVNAAQNCVSPWSEPDSVKMPVAMPAPIMLAANDIAHNAMTAVWQRDEANFADETAWRIALVLHDSVPKATDWLDATTASQMFIGLLNDTAYDIHLCAYDAASGMTSDTVMLANVRTLPFPDACEQIGTGNTTTSYFLPGMYGWHYFAALYPIETSGNIESLGVTAMYSSNGLSNMEIWVKVVDGDFAFDAATTTFSSMTADATSIYSGADNIVSGLNQIPLASPVAVSEGEQLLVLVRSVCNDPTGSGSKTVRATSVSGKTWRIAKDNSDIDPTTATISSPTSGANASLTEARPNLQLCYEPVTCLQVKSSNIYSDAITDSSASLSWYPGNEESSWQYAYSTSDTMNAAELEAAAMVLNTNNISLTGLTRDTNYTFYIRPICSDTDTGAWTKYTFRTLFVLYNYSVEVAYDTTMGTVSGAEDTVYVEGTVLTLVAEPATGYHFTGWSNGETSATLTLTVDGDTTLTANFAINVYTITANVNNAQMGTVTAPATAEHGEEITLTATPNDGYRFLGWSNGDTNTTITITVTANVTITARFEQIPVYRILLASANTTMGSVTPGLQNVREGEQVTATATANDGYRFVNWTDANGNVVSTDNPYVFAASADITLTANFESTAVLYTVTGIADSSYMGIVLGAGDYAENATVTLVAQAYEGFKFLHWTDANGNIVSEENPYIFNVTADVTYIAVFVRGTLGIDDLEAADVTVFATDNKIVVRGAEGNAVFVFDVNGRMLHKQNAAAASEEFVMNNSGVYLVKVGNAPAKRVVVMR